MDGTIHIPGKVELSEISPQLKFWLILYFIIGFIIVFTFFRPDTLTGILLVVRIAIFWNAL